MPLLMVVEVYGGRGNPFQGANPEFQDNKDLQESVN